ncbi:hypothetical protein ACFXO9_26790 [Nocardia tengchongensis]|uniref:hypothetical protein n=1 Tax=Nocardia tengchongensis TaxID=2055889 RepID=UPI00368CF239
MSELSGEKTAEPMQFTAPSATHKILLREIQNTAKQCADMVEDHRTFGEITGALAPQPFYAAYQRRTDWGRELEAMARAGGVPDNWIAHVRGKGEQSITWHDTQKYWPTPVPVDRHGLIEKLSTTAQTLQTALAVAATSRIFAPTGERFWPMGQLGRFMTASWEHITGVGLLLEPTVAEREQIWPTGPEWAYAAVTKVHAWEDQALATWWNELSPPGSSAMELAHIPELAGLARARERLIVQPLPELVDLAGTAHRSLGHPVENPVDNGGHSAAQTEAGHGRAIAEAIAAATLNSTEPMASGPDTIATSPVQHSPSSLEVPGPEP